MMALMRPRLIGALLAAFVVAVGCTSERSEEKNWRKNKELVEQYAVEFPSFKTAIEARYAEASKMFEAAKADGDEKKRLEGMKDANEHLNDLMSHFKAYKDKRESLRKLLMDPVMQDLPAREFKPAENAANASIEKAKKHLDTSTATTAGAIKDVVKEAGLFMDEATVALTQLKQRATEKQAAAKEAQRAQEAADKAAREAAAGTTSQPAPASGTPVAPGTTR